MLICNKIEKIKKVFTEYFLNGRIYLSNGGVCMGFNEFKYERPNYEKIKEKLMGLIDKINESNNIIEVKELINEINNIRNDIGTVSTIASIRYSINTEDEFYSKEREYWDEYEPLYNEINSEFYKVIVNNKFRLELEKEFGKQFFSIAEYNHKSIF